jgi:hypothetical protein
VIDTIFPKTVEFWKHVYGNPASVSICLHDHQKEKGGNCELKKSIISIIY